jgi:hypothetical protein
MASYAIAAVQTELKLTLYNREVYSRSDINGVTIIEKDPMGTTWVFSRGLLPTGEAPMQMSSAFFKAQVFKLPILPIMSITTPLD